MWETATPCYFSVSPKCELNMNISILQVVVIEEKAPDLYWIKESWIMVNQVGSIYSRGEMEVSPILHIFVLVVSPHWVPINFGSNNHFQLGSHICNPVPMALQKSTSEPCQVPKNLFNTSTSRVFLFWRTNHLRLRTPYILYLAKYQTPSSGTAVYTCIYHRNIRNPQNKKPTTQSFCPK